MAAPDGATDGAADGAGAYKFAIASEDLRRRVRQIACPAPQSDGYPWRSAIAAFFSAPEGSMPAGTPRASPYWHCLWLNAD
jgi:hypothetical protein